MPIHEYECEVCGNRLERLYLAGEKVLEEITDYCDLGGTVQTFKKTISQSNFKLKGFGWAFDGYNDRPWGNKPYHRAVKEDGYVPGSYVKTGKPIHKKEDSSGN